MVNTNNPIKTRSGTAFSGASRPLMLLGCGATLLGHIYLLRQVDMAWTEAPISALTQLGSAWGHAAVLAVFACTQALLAHRVNYPNAGILTRCIKTLSLINAVLIVSLGYIFTLQNSTFHTAMLWIIASLAGVMMWCLVARRISAQNNLKHSIAHGGFLLVWLALMPLYLLVEPGVEGLYQRTVGIVYLAWLGTLALLIRKR